VTIAKRGSPAARSRAAHAVNVGSPLARSHGSQQMTLLASVRTPTETVADQPFQRGTAKPAASKGLPEVRLRGSLPVSPTCRTATLQERYDREATPAKFSASLKCSWGELCEIPYTESLSARIGSAPEGITMAKTEGPSPIDIHVGSRMRMRRMAVGMSQEKLANTTQVRCPQPISTISSRARKGCGSRRRLCAYAHESVVVSSIS
jgi:hypothetical protein